MASFAASLRPLNAIVSHQSRRGPPKFQDVLDAFEFVSAGQLTENEAFLSKETGAIHRRSECGDDFDELPSDIDEDNK